MIGDGWADRASIMTDPAPESVEPVEPDPPVLGSEEEIDEAGTASFPASDAPPWWAGRAS